MASIGIGISLGRQLVGLEPTDDVDTPAAVMSATSSLVAVGVEGLSALDPLSIVTSKTFSIFSSADAGVTDSSGVTAWVNQAVATHWAQGGAAGTRGAYAATDATLGGRGSITFNGSSSWLTNATNPAAPGTTPMFIRMVAKLITRVAGHTMVGYATTSRGIGDNSSPNLVRAHNGVAGGSIAMALGTWYVIDCLLGNATTDYLHIGSTKQTGLALGNNDWSIVSLGARSDGAAGWSNLAVAQFSLLNGEPTAPEKAAWNAHVNKWYKGNVVLPT